MKMKLAVLILVTFWCISLSFGHEQIDGDGNVRMLPKRFSKVRKRQEDLGYLEQCSILQFWDKQIGRVNVLAFFDSSWQFSHRQAAMLRVLKERFDRTGFDNIQFFAVNAAVGEGQYISKAEIELEEETWKQISPSEADGLPPVVVSPEALIEALGPDVYFIQDTDELQIWSKLRAFRDQILVIDRCGKLTYQVIVPWSILHFPYVKAAILSTYKDEPCGHCQYQESPDESTSELYDATTTPDEILTTPFENENFEQINIVASSTVVPQIENDQPMKESHAILNIDSKIDSSAVSEESSTTATSTENEQTSLRLEESSTLMTQTDIEKILSSSEEASTLLARTEGEPSSFLSSEDESSTIIGPSENDEISPEFEESSTFVQDDELLSIPEESSTKSDYSTIEDRTEPNLLETTTLAISTENSSGRNSDESLILNKTENYDAELEQNVSTPTSETDSDYDAILNVTDENHADTTTETNLESTAKDTDETTDNLESTTVKLEIVDLEKLNSTDVNDDYVTEEISETENQTTTEIPNTSEKVVELSLEDPKKTAEKNVESSDALKSRSPNARSVSPNDGSENRLETVEVNSETSDQQDQLESDYIIPIRIIMRAPHVDELKDRTMKVHEYLVLKTGQPNYHEHLDSVPQDFDESHKFVHKKSEAVKSTFGKDESPGLYGELADYWQNFGNEHNQDSTESNNEDGDEQVLEQETIFAEGSVTLKPIAILKDDSKENKNNQYEGTSSSTKEIDGESSVYDETNNSNDEVDVLDEEAKSKLIAHYSKLLPWLYYVLAK